jgi:cytochrome oxidase Cu insertion factor (SCO1/SenC/PrrC family)
MVKKIPGLFFLLAVLAIATVAQQPASASTPQQPAPPQTHLKVGQTAPDFTLTNTEGKEVKLSDFKGKRNVVLAFYVLAFTGG